MSMGTATPLPPEEMQLLAWKFLDGYASDAEQQQLASCLNDDAGARTVYLQCVQMHVDLLAHFGGLPKVAIVDKLSPKAQEQPAMPVVFPVVSPLPLMNSPSPF